MPFSFLVRSKLAICVTLVALALLPFGGVWFGSEQIISIPLSEYPVKLWGYIRFWEEGRLFGGTVDELGFPYQSSLNNPDIFATFIVGGLAPYIGESLSYNLLLFVVMLANISGMYFLARQWKLSIFSALTSSVFLGWNALVLSYGFASCISDLIHLWPYCFSLALLRRALDDCTVSTSLGAGIFLALGLWTCPYNFVLFLPALLFILPWIFVQYGRKSFPVIGWSVGMVAILGGIYAWQLFSLMNTEQSLVNIDDVQNVRHSYPFDQLRPEGEARFTSFLMDFFLGRSGGLILVEQVAHFARAFFVGWIAFGVGLFGLYRAENHLRWLWGGIALFFVLVSTGPYLNVTPDISLPFPWNPVYLMAYLFPGGNLMLEPFRYALVGYLAFGMLVGIGMQAVSRRWQLGLMVGIIVEIVVGTPIGFPLPTQKIETNTAMQQLQQVPDGGIIHLPFFVSDRILFDRDHFQYQLIHEHPIGNIIMGFPPPVYLENQLLCQLLHVEKTLFPIHVSEFSCKTNRFLESVPQLQTLGFQAIVMEQDKYDPTSAQQARELLEQVLVGEEMGDLIVYKLY